MRLHQTEDWHYARTLSKISRANFSRSSFTICNFRIISQIRNSGLFGNLEMMKTHLESHLQESQFEIYFYLFINVAKPTSLTSQCHRIKNINISSSTVIILCDRHHLQHLGPFHKAYFQWQITKISDKSADNQSETRISVAYNKNCHLSLMTSFVKCLFSVTNTTCSIWDPFHKAFFQWQLTKISGKSADSQSEARISLAYNKNYHLSLVTSFVKCPPPPPPGQHYLTFVCCVSWQTTAAEPTLAPIANITPSALNVAPYYDDTFPVFFNIFLWMGVILVIAVVVVTSMLGNMDPGDSIIYRMTSQRIKIDWLKLIPVMKRLLKYILSLR